MKRIFSILLAVLLVITAVPFVGIEANALGLDEEGTICRITFSAGDGTGKSRTFNYDVGETITLPYASEFGFKKVVNEGKENEVKYYCTGWNIGKQGASYKVDKTNKTDNEGQYLLTATALWAKEGTSSSESSSSSSSSNEKYTVTYKPGKAEGKDVVKTYDYGENFTLIGNPYTYKNHSFEGWEFSNGNIYQPGDKVKAPNQNVVFTASWSSDGITITGGKVESIAIKTKPDKTSYKVGEKLDTTGLSIEVTMDDGKKETKTEGFEVSPSGELKTAGTTTITVTYKGKTDTFTVTVKDPNASSSASSSQPKPSSSSSSSQPKPSSSSSSSESSSEPESSSSSSSSSVPEITPPADVFEPITLAFSIDGDIPVTKIEFNLKEDIGEEPKLSIVPLDGYSVSDAAAEKFIADGDALAAFDISLLTGTVPYTGKLSGTVTYHLNGTQASAGSNYDSYVLAMVHSIDIAKFDGEYYMTDGENTYLYNSETDFKNAVANVKLLEEDGVNRLVIKDISGLQSFAYQAAENLIVEVKLVASRDAVSSSIDVTSLSPVMLVQIQVGEAKASGGIPVWVWIVIAVIVVLMGILVALYLINRNNERRATALHEGYGVRSGRSSSVITGFDDEE